MISSGDEKLPFIYWGKNPRTGHPDFNQPVFHGMIEGFLTLLMWFSAQTINYLVDYPEHFCMVTNRL